MNPIADEFDALAARYESYRLAPWYKAHADEILRHVPAGLAGPVLDVGCGTGYLLRRLAKRHPGIPCTGIDIAPNMIGQAVHLAGREGLNDIRFICSDWETLDFDALAQHPFELAVCANAFHYFANPESAARKLFDALDEGGTLLVLERDRSGSLLTSLWGWLHRHVIRDHVQFHDEKALAALLAEAGFERVETVARVKRLEK